MDTFVADPELAQASEALEARMQELKAARKADTRGTILFEEPVTERLPEGYRITLRVFDPSLANLMVARAIGTIVLKDGVRTCRIAIEAYEQTATTVVVENLDERVIVSLADADGTGIVQCVKTLAVSVLLDFLKEYIARLAQMSGLERELVRRQMAGHRPVTVAQMEQRLGELGYRLDRTRDCHSINRYMTGPAAGESYPAINTGVKEADTGISFANEDARRDHNFDKLQALRADGSLFACVRGRLLEI